MFSLAQLGELVRSELIPVEIDFDVQQAVNCLLPNLSDDDQRYLYMVAMGLLFSNKFEL